MPVSFQCLDEGWEKRDEPFRANAIRRMPCQEQRALDFWSVMTLPPPLSRVQRLRGMIQEPQGISASVSSGGGNFVKQCPFL
jgi:hypothetical protein